MNPQLQGRPEPSPEPVSAPPPPVVPDLLGLGLGEACSHAAWAGASVDATSVQRGHGPWNLVVAQSPPPGTRLLAQRRIHVLVSVPPSMEEADGG